MKAATPPSSYVLHLEEGGRTYCARWACAFIFFFQSKLFVQSSPDTRERNTIDYVWMLVYFIVLPWEYNNTTGDTQHYFRLYDVQFKVGYQDFTKVLLATTANICTVTLA